MARLTSRIQEATAKKLQKQYEARVKVLEIVVDISYPLTSLQDERKWVFTSGRGVNV